MKKAEFFLLMLIILGAFIVRLYRFNSPIADWHSWRQADTSAVSRNFVKYGFDVFHPKFDDFSKGVSLLDNPQGYRFVEFPFYNIAQGGLFTIFKYFTIEEWGRIVTILSCISALFFLYLIVRRHGSMRQAVIAASFFAIIPYNIYYGRVLLPDMSTVAMLLASIYVFDLWIEKNRLGFYFLSIVLYAFALLMKPYALFFILPFLYLLYKKFGNKALMRLETWAFIIISITPLLLWRIWMSQYPEGIPQSNWLFNGNGIRFKGAFFHWIFADRISSLILGYFGLPFVILGIILREKKEEWFFQTFLLSALIYMTVMATGNIQHDYYQIFIVPMLAIFYAKGFDFLLTHADKHFYRFTTYGIILASVLLMMAFGWFRIRDYYNIQHLEIVEAGMAIDKIIPSEAKVVAPYNGDTTFLYYVNRRGWPVVDRSYKDLQKAGAQYLVFANPTQDEINNSALFPVIAKTDYYIVFDMVHPLKPLK